MVRQYSQKVDWNTLVVKDVLDGLVVEVLVRGS